jgi:DNA-binding NarL/FixJ family response regulator
LFSGRRAAAIDKLRIFLAEDHAVVREGLKLLVNAQPDMEVVGEAGDGETAWRRALELQPSVVVMDVTLPELNGIQAARRLKEGLPQTKVLALTVHESSGYLKELMQAGASGYVLKRAAAEELIGAIRVISRGGTYVDPAMGGKVQEDRVEGAYLGAVQDETALSLREREVLCMIAEGYSNKEIAAQLKISPKTIETYKYRAMEKIGLRSRAEIVRYVLKQGWML